jgi:hypothetical protein
MNIHTELPGPNHWALQRKLFRPSRMLEHRLLGEPAPFDFFSKS